LGIRITRRLGYALTDFQYDMDIYEATDLRINIDLINQDDSLYEMQTAFAEWALNESAEVEVVLLETLGLSPWEARFALEVFSDHAEEHGTYTSFHKVMTHTPEFGESNILLFQPLTHTEWTRHDDTVDFYTSVLRGDQGLENEVLDLLELERCGIYPYEKYMVRYPDVETPEQFLKGVQSEEGSLGIRQGKLPIMAYQMLVGTYREGSKPRVGGEALRHFLEDWNVTIPLEILLFAHWSNIFTDFNTVYRLRPVLYTYWS